MGFLSQRINRRNRHNGKRKKGIAGGEIRSGLHTLFLEKTRKRGIQSGEVIMYHTDRGAVGGVAGSALSQERVRWLAGMFSELVH